MKKAVGFRISCVKIVLTAVGILGILAGCGVHKPFAPLDDNVQFKSGSLAVISGDSSEPTMVLTQFLTQELKQRSSYRVMGQEEIARRVGKYPVTIKRATPEQEEKPVWFAKGEKSKLDAMQAQLKTDYLLVVWTANLRKMVVSSQQGGNRVTYSAWIEGNLVEYPKSRAVGYSDFGNSKDQTCCLFGKSEGDDINELLKYSAKELADEFMTATKSEKPAK
jgi:hypothetical protein